MKNSIKTNEKILCVRPDSMGDVLMTTPAFRALKETFPQIHLTLLTSLSGKAIAEFIPEIDDIIAADLPWEKAGEKTDSKEVNKLIQKLKKKNFYRAIIFTTFSQTPLLSALVCYLAAVPKRLAYSHTKPYGLLTDWLKDTEPHGGIRHEVERQLALVRLLGATTSDTRLSLQVPTYAKEQIRKNLTIHNISLRKTLIIIHPGAKSIKRQYAPKEFAEIATRLDTLGYQIIFTGDAQEKEIVELIGEYTNNKFLSFVGKLTLSEFIALISLASLLISNNTGPVHIAAAVGTPVIDLYALTNPQHTPWKVLSKVLYFEVSKDLQHEVVNNGIPTNSIPLENPKQVVMEALKLLNQSKNLQHSL